MRILILCTGNSCRSQMAEGFLKSFDSRPEVFSAGTDPAPHPNPRAVLVMREAGIDISGNIPKNVEIFLSGSFDFVVTVCGGAKEVCPAFTGNVKNRLHIGFDDPADATGSEDEVMAVYRRVREEIRDGFWKFYNEKIKPETDKEAAELKAVVKEKYGTIAREDNHRNHGSCCGVRGCCEVADYSIFSEDYKKIPGYNPDADMELGCGIPTDYAGIRHGDRVLDLGSGAGNDCFVARALVGEEGHVTGIDFTAEMVMKARQNNEKMGFSNVEFVHGDIESMPFPDHSFDVVLSNCVLNLVPDKAKAFSEISRVLSTGGHFCISDVVIRGDMPPRLKEDAVMYAGCVSGATEIDKYMDIIKMSGFRDIMVHKQKSIEIPGETLQKYLSPTEMESFRNGRNGIFSITVSGTRG